MLMTGDVTTLFHILSKFGRTYFHIPLDCFSCLDLNKHLIYTHLSYLFIECFWLLFIFLLALFPSSQAEMLSATDWLVDESYMIAPERVSVLPCTFQPLLQKHKYSDNRYCIP